MNRLQMIKNEIKRRLKRSQTQKINATSMIVYIYNNVSDSELLDIVPNETIIRLKNDLDQAVRLGAEMLLDAAIESINNENAILN